MDHIGSSPLARGLLGVGEHVAQVVGIIPARAGFTSDLQVCPGRLADHPRSRGVYISGICPIADMWGSSPLARGLPRRPGPDPRPVGIIPARAGFTRPGRGAWTCPADHPRSRGVYRHSAWPGPGAPGSSPLARGLPSSVSSGLRVSGIIPARAGFTCDADDGYCDREDHPRSRGVYPAPLSTA